MTDTPSNEQVGEASLSSLSPSPTSAPLVRCEPAGMIMLMLMLFLFLFLSCSVWVGFVWFDVGCVCGLGGGACVRRRVGSLAANASSIDVSSRLMRRCRILDVECWLGRVGRALRTAQQLDVLPQIVRLSLSLCPISHRIALTSGFSQ